LATVTGYAVRSDNGIGSGVWDCTPPPERPGARLAWLQKKLDLTLMSVGRIDAIWYEYVRHHTKGATIAAHVYGALQGKVHEFAYNNTIRCRGISEMDLKKLATGKARASKNQMKGVARQRFGIEPVDDNEADALCLLAVTMRPIPDWVKIYK
jgi:Holliday junction resolvasome RuvABC endonuclease subunit